MKMSQLKTKNIEIWKTNNENEFHIINIKCS